MLSQELLLNLGEPYTDSEIADLGTASYKGDDFWTDGYICLFKDLPDIDSVPAGYRTETIREYQERTTTPAIPTDIRKCGKRVMVRFSFDREPFHQWFDARYVAAVLKRADGPVEYLIGNRLQHGLGSQILLIRNGQDIGLVAWLGQVAIMDDPDWNISYNQ